MTACDSIRSDIRHRVGVPPLSITLTLTINPRKDCTVTMPLWLLDVNKNWNRYLCQS